MARKRITVIANAASKTLALEKSKNETPDMFDQIKFGGTPTKPYSAKEYKVVSLRECPLPATLQICETPKHAEYYWRLHVETNPYYNPEAECFVVLLLNTRKRVKGHQLLTIGTLDTVLVHPREVFRGAIIAGASAILMMHNYSSCDPTA